MIPCWKTFRRLRGQICVRIILRHAAFIHLRGEFGVQLEVGVSFCRGMRAKDGQITSPIWSAATCRRYGLGVRTKAATSRRTPKELVRLQLTRAVPEATPT